MSCVYAYALLLCWLVFKRVGFDVRVWFKFDLPCDVVWLSFFVVVVFVFECACFVCLMSMHAVCELLCDDVCCFMCIGVLVCVA